MLCRERDIFEKMVASAMFLGGEKEELPWEKGVP
jgi:hypothetical protein